MFDRDELLKQIRDRLQDLPEEIGRKIAGAGPGDLPDALPGSMSRTPGLWRAGEGLAHAVGRFAPATEGLGRLMTDLRHLGEAVVDVFRALHPLKEAVPVGPRQDGAARPSPTPPRADGDANLAPFIRYVFPRRRRQVYPEPPENPQQLQSPDSPGLPAPRPPAPLLLGYKPPPPRAPETTLQARLGTSLWPGNPGPPIPVTPYTPAPTTTLPPPGRRHLPGQAPPTALQPGGPRFPGETTLQGRMGTSLAPPDAGPTRLAPAPTPTPMPATTLAPTRLAPGSSTAAPQGGQEQTGVLREVLQAVKELTRVVQDQGRKDSDADDTEGQENWTGRGAGHEPGGVTGGTSAPLTHAMEHIPNGPPTDKREAAARGLDWAAIAKAMLLRRR